MRCAVWMTAWLTALSAVSCGGDTNSSGGNSDGGSPDAGNGVTADQACAETASALCSKYDACAPFAINVLFGDMSTCVDAAKTVCLGSLQASKTAATPAGYWKCSQDLKASVCDDILAHEAPASCRPTGGTVGDGMACGDDWQCTSGHCNIPDNTTCGVCASLATAGGACPNKTDDECAYGLVCADNHLCVAPAAAGAACDANHPCIAPNVCVGATATAQGTCTAGGALGAACSDQSCSLLQGLWCGRGATRTCATIMAADPGMPCGLLSTTMYALCKGGGSNGGCNVVTGTAMGTCPHLAAPGEACSAATPCKVGAKCVNGLCSVRDPAACR